ncbi:MAG: aromatic amino acid lyase, partial [Planctomycetota bacterium]
MNTVVLDHSQVITPEDVSEVAHGRAKVELSDSSRSSIAACRQALDVALDDGEAHYGINTGFGSLAKVRVRDSELADLQRNLIRSHAAGVGAPLSEEVVRGMMFVLAASLCRGRSGVRVELAEKIVQLLNASITPIVPESGSVGASGDLAPLAHLSLVLIGEGEAALKGERLPGGEALRRAGLTPIALAAKEGLALINGTHLMTARMSLIYTDLQRVINAAFHACAMSIDGARASHSYLDPRVYEARNQPGPSKVAATMRELLQGSDIVDSHRENDPRVQDPYSFRCAPLVLGAALDAVDWCGARLKDQLGAVTH